MLSRGTQPFSANHCREKWSQESLTGSHTCMDCHHRGPFCHCSHMSPTLWDFLQFSQPAGQNQADSEKVFTYFWLKLYFRMKFQDFLECCPFTEKKTKQHIMSISPEIQNSGILFLFVICQQHHTDFQSLEVK